MNVCYDIYLFVNCVVSIFFNEYCLIIAFEYYIELYKTDSIFLFAQMTLCDKTSGYFQPVFHKTSFRPLLLYFLVNDFFF